MNHDQFAGSLKIALGWLNARLAQVSGNALRARHAEQQQLDGRLQRAIGQTRVLVRRSLKQHMPG